MNKRCRFKITDDWPKPKILWPNQHQSRPVTLLKNQTYQVVFLMYVYEEWSYVCFKKGKGRSSIVIGTYELCSLDYSGKNQFQYGICLRKRWRTYLFLMKKVHLQSLLMRAFPGLDISEEYLVLSIWNCKKIHHQSGICL